MLNIIWNSVNSALYLVCYFFFFLMFTVFFFFLVVPCGLQDLSFLTANWTRAPCSRSVESWPPACLGNPLLIILAVFWYFLIPDSFSYIRPWLSLLQDWISKKLSKSYKNKKSVPGAQPSLPTRGLSISRISSFVPVARASRIELTLTLHVSLHISRLGFLVLEQVWAVLSSTCSNNNR